MKKQTYKERLEEGKTDTHTTTGYKCSICGEQLSSRDDMTGYYSRRSHFESHDLDTSQARYAALSIGDGDVEVAALGAFAKQISPKDAK